MKSLHSHIKKYLAKGIYPFHLPGHKGNRSFFLPDLQAYDLTEIPGMDVLGQPSGILRQLQENIAAFYGADESFFLVNGASAGVVAAICAVCRDGDVLFAARNAHKSVFNGMVMAGAMPQYFLPEMRPDGIAGGVCPSVFDTMPHGAAALIVSPTYEGYVSDVAQIAKKVHERNGVLIVDEAHGAHFKFHKAFPKSALECGADIVIHSLHKTLPVPGQCAVLHINSQRIEPALIRFFVNAMQTTSPSYMLMAGADYALHKLWKKPQLFEKYTVRLDEFKQRFAHSLAGEMIGQHGIFAVDAGKLLFRLPEKNGSAIAAHWAKKHKIQVEMAHEGHILAMTSVADTDEGFRRLGNAVGELDAGKKKDVARRVCETATVTLPAVPLPVPPPVPPSLPKIITPPRMAVRSTSQELIAPCPPGIIEFAPGEDFTNHTNVANFMFMEGNARGIF